MGSITLRQPIEESVERDPEKNLEAAWSLLVGLEINLSFPLPMKWPFLSQTPGCDTTHIDEEPLPHPRSCANLSLLHFIPPLSGSTGNGEPPQGRSVPGGIPVSARKHDPDVPTPGTWGGHKGASAECVPHVQLSPVPYSPERGIVTLAYLTDEETEVTWSCYLGPRVAPRESLLTPASRPRFQVPPGVLLLHLLDSKC